MSNPAPTPKTSSEPHGLRRDLGATIAIAVVVGNVIGSGIFLKPGTIAADGGRFGLIISVWIFGGVLCVLGGLCFAELSAMHPKAGGMYVYLREAYGKLVAFLFGWTEVIFGKPASIGALAVAFVGSLTLNINAILFPDGQARIPAYIELLLAIGVIMSLAWVNMIGVIWGGRMQVATTVIKAGFLAVVGALPFVLAPFVENSVDFANYGTTVTPAKATLTAQVGAVLLAVMWAYNGWHGVTPLAEEVREPQRNVPLALFTGIAILTVLYVTANLAYHGVLSMSEMRDAGQHSAEAMLFKLFGPFGRATVSAVIMCSTFGAINSNLLQAPRISFAMGRDRVFFSTLGQVHATYRTPLPAILVMALMSIALILSAAAGKWLVADIETAGFRSEIVRQILESLKTDSIFDLLTNFVIFSASIFYVLAVLAVIILRYRQPDLERPYKTWGYPLTPIAFLVVYFWFLSQVYSTNRLESHAGIALILVGLPFYFGYRRWSARHPVD